MNHNTVSTRIISFDSVGPRICSRFHLYCNLCLKPNLLVNSTVPSELLSCFARIWHTGLKAFHLKPCLHESIILVVHQWSSNKDMYYTIKTAWPNGSSNKLFVYTPTLITFCIVRISEYVNPLIQKSMLYIMLKSWNSFKIYSLKIRCMSIKYQNLYYLLW